ncbi:MAG: 4-alpha-glucanotransferase [Cyanobacteria bacterium P01_A01_bin.17]
MPFPRASGLLLHPTSLPGSMGIGDLGQAAYDFVDFMHQSGQRLWQVLPLGPTAFGHSPYMSYSAMAGNVLLISLERLRDQGLLESSDLEVGVGFRPGTVSYELVDQIKLPLLLKAFQNFRRVATVATRQAFAEFCRTRIHWLDDYAFFMALKAAHRGTAWNTWELGLVRRDPETLRQWKGKLANEIELHKFLQFEFFQQWSSLRQYANERSIQIIGDIPIYVAHNSADVWSNPEQFHLDPQTGEPALMAGVPPDYFSETGQLWGNPIYRWDRMQADGFKWWLQRFRTMLDYVDLIRVDHFRGFESYWQIRQGENTAINGEWVPAPGVQLFEALNNELGRLPILAEDLGIITPEVEALRDRFGFPGMKILHFAFGSGAGNPYLPHSCPRNCLIYTGTHDNDTTAGWFSAISADEQQIVSDYVGGLSDEGIHWDLIRLALRSVANQVIIPVQDLLGLGSDARMNLPSTAGGNWVWRYDTHDLTDEIRDRLLHLTQIYNRVY